MAKKNDPPKASPSGRQALEKIAPSATEISVARSGFLKPYAICFQQLPDNIAREPLGLLAGVMAIGDRSEHSAYIVNFLASLAKKEYYGNPRRGALESFESSLHKINVGLAELAKEGSTEWIGTLDAALCAIERNNLHFSVAGKAKVLLFRDRHLSDISDGLAEEGDINPMKTFTDVASGKISPGDRIIITTPEIFSVLSETELERSANRLSGEAFERLLQTALINKLDLAATVSISIGTIAEIKRPPAPKKKLATIDTIPNAWSHTIFETSKHQGGSIEDELRNKKESEQDRIDDKTGHIYVTGETPREESSEAWARVRYFLGDARRSIQHAGSLFANHASRGIASLVRETGRMFIRLTSSLREAMLSFQHRRNLKKLSERDSFPESTSPIPTITKELSEKRSVTTIEKSTTITETLSPSRFSITHLITKSIRVLETLPRPSLPKRASLHIPVQDDPDTPDRYPRLVIWIRSIFDRTLHTIANSAKRLSSKQKIFLLSILGVTLLTALLFGFFFRNSPPREESVLLGTEETALSEPSRPLQNDTKIRFLEAPTAIMNASDIIEVTRLNDSIFCITRNALYRIGENGADAIRVDNPDGSITIHAVAMEDLNSIITISEDGSVFFYTPINNRFTKQNIVLANPENIASLATRSTYLYILNRDDSGILRYPRIEGGFGPGTPWLKETAEIKENPTITVSDSVFIADISGLRAYFRGIPKDTVFETTATPVSYTTILAVPSANDAGTLFALDSAAGRIIRYDLETGALLAQYAHDALIDAKHFTVNPETNTAYISTDNTLLMAKLP